MFHTHFNRIYTQTEQCLSKNSFVSSPPSNVILIKNPLTEMECVYNQKLGFGSSYTLIIPSTFTFDQNVSRTNHLPVSDKCAAVWLRVTQGRACVCVCVCPAVCPEHQRSDWHPAQHCPHGLADPSVFPHHCRGGGLLCHWSRVRLLTGKTHTHNILGQSDYLMLKPKSAQVRWLALFSNSIISVFPNVKSSLRFILKIFTKYDNPPFCFLPL